MSPVLSYKHTYVQFPNVQVFLSLLYLNLFPLKVNKEIKKSPAGHPLERIHIPQGSWFFKRPQDWSYHAVRSETGQSAGALSLSGMSHKKKSKG